MATIRLFTDESVSLRSFRVNSLSSSPPSVKASSLKVRRSLAFLTSRGRPPQHFEPTLNDLIRNPDLSLPMGLPANDPPAAQTKNSLPAERQDDLKQRPRSKSRTMIRKLTSKFTTRSGSTPVSVAKSLSIRPPVAPPAFQKEQRDTALRERGLLPPLRPNKDLSRQEMEQDQEIPIVPPAEPSTQSEASAAHQIKKEWEAKNSNLQEIERQKMNGYKFGTSSPASSPSVQVEFGAPIPQFPETCIPNSLSLTPGAELAPEIEANSRPLPPLPSPSRKSDDDLLDHSFLPLSPISVPLPQGPSSLALPPTPTSLNRNPSDVVPEEPTDNTSLTQGPPILPAISFTPPSTFPSPIDGSTPPLAPDNLISSAFHARTDSQLEKTVSPSLALSSDTLASTSPSTLVTEPSLTSGKGKLGALTVKVQEGSNIPIIIESPTEDIFSDEMSAVVEESTPGEEKGAYVVEEPKSPRARRSRRMPFIKRGATDPTSGLERKKTSNPFKRGNTVDSEDTSESSDSQQRGVTMAASFTSIRRSVVGTFSRPRSIFSEASGQKTFNVSRLPPSPTSPVSSRRREPIPRPPPRQPVAPIIYSRGTILLEASTIEDEETRRMTELAFM